jgi:hypothetical protein
LFCESRFVHAVVLPASKFFMKGALNSFGLPRPGTVLLQTRWQLHQALRGKKTSNKLLSVLVADHWRPDTQ